MTKHSRMRFQNKAYHNFPLVLTVGKSQTDCIRQRSNNERLWGSQSTVDDASTYILTTGT